MSKIKDETLDEIIDFLRGTCLTLNDAIIKNLDESYDEDNLTTEQLSTIDNEIFLCQSCHWWNEISEVVEVGGEYFCTDCKDEEE